VKILITGACGFVGSTLAAALVAQADATISPVEIIGLDNLSRVGSEINRPKLAALGVKFFHGDLRFAEDLRQLPRVDWVIDVAANPSVLAGIDGKSSSRSVFDHNLLSTINLLEFCKERRAGFILLSTSRVYSIAPLSRLPMVQKNGAFAFSPSPGTPGEVSGFGDCPRAGRGEGQSAIGDRQSAIPVGVSGQGVSEDFTTEPPISLYGSSKLASEILALEYGGTFDFPVWINRCGVLAGAGQFGRADQGIFAFWINAYLRRRPLKYIGFGGRGWQARDALHPLDLLPILKKQFAFSGNAPRRMYNFGGGPAGTMSLLQLSDWCRARFGEHPITADLTERKFDVPWMVMDYSRAAADWNWRPQIALEKILDEIAAHAERNPDWLTISGA